MKVTPEQLAEWKRICEAATPGPWRNNEADRTIVDEYHARNAWKKEGVPYLNLFRYPHRTSDYPISHDEWKANPEFVAVARTAMPALIEECERLRIWQERCFDVIDVKNKYKEENKKLREASYKAIEHLENKGAYQIACIKLKEALGVEE